jgi:serine/threonine protein kinase
MVRGSLRELLQGTNKPLLTGTQIISIALSAARGMNYLHTLHQPLVHGSLSSHNILLQESWQVKVCQN